jgi:hypothetical protein
VLFHGDDIEAGEVLGGMKGSILESWRCWQVMNGSTYISVTEELVDGLGSASRRLYKANLGGYSTIS